MRDAERTGEEQVRRLGESEARSTGGGNAPVDRGQRRLLICNPKSGTEDHVETVERLATDHGFEVRQTEYEEHAVELAREAGEEGVDILAVAGGDGTVHEVVHGLVDANRLDEVTLGVVPAGTENIFAGNIGATDIETAFEVIERGERRRLDVGFAGEEPFIMSCIAGLPAEASVETSSELKSKLGSLAFVVAGLQKMATFDGLDIEMTAVSNGEEIEWEGEALCALVGNIRRFAKEGGQANVEDGLFEVVVIEQMPPSNMLSEATAHRLFGKDTDNVLHVQASQLRLTGRENAGIRFSFDGELRTHDELVLHTHPQALTVCVGDDYDPEPDDE